MKILTFLGLALIIFSGVDFYGANHSYFLTFLLLPWLLIFACLLKRSRFYFSFFLLYTLFFFISIFLSFLLSCPPESFSTGESCHSCNTEERIFLRCELPDKELRKCPNRKIIFEDCFFYSVLSDYVPKKWELCLDGGYWGCPHYDHILRHLMILGFFDLVLVIAFLILSFKGKKRTNEAIIK